MNLAQLKNIYVVVELPCRHPQSLLQFQSIQSNKKQNNKETIKKNKYRNIERKNKICPFLSINVQVSGIEADTSIDSNKGNILVEKALALAEKHELPPSFNCSSKGSGIEDTAQVIIIASKGANSGQPKKPSPALIFIFR